MPEVSESLLDGPFFLKDFRELLISKLKDFEAVVTETFETQVSR